MIFDKAIFEKVIFDKALFDKVIFDKVMNSFDNVSLLYIGDFRNSRNSIFDKDTETINNFDKVI